MTGVRAAAATFAAMLLCAAALHAQQPSLPSALSTLAQTERAFAARAMVVGWKQAFLEYFADDAVGFDGDKTESAKAQLKPVPDPPKDLQLLWEPRFGDIAASGELGWLTGPSTTINPARNNGAPRYGNYASVWKRQPDGTFKVVLDVGIPVPMEPTFAPGFTRASAADRYTGRDTVAAATMALRTADTTLNQAAQRSQEMAYTSRVTPDARLHRPGLLPLTSAAAIDAWARTQPPYSAAETRFAETAQSRDLGYTYGTYAVAAAGESAAQEGFYTRVWVRGRDGGWRVALDVLQPQ
jgi:ketosteroid isomerase-like protein